MKKNYKTIKQTLCLLALCFATSMISAQNIQLSFANAENTNDGFNDYYEADIMIETIGGLADFKVGSGQIYFNYNTAAFGENVSNNNKFFFEQPANSIAGAAVFSGSVALYGPFIQNDNITSRVSTAFLQGASEGTMTLNNLGTVASTPTLLFHIKIQYVDVSKEPMVSFEDDNSVLDMATDQFFTACGPSTPAPFATQNCTNFSGAQIVGAVFDSSNADIGSTLNIEGTKELGGYSIYPNPTKGDVTIKGTGATLSRVEVFNIIGQNVLTSTSNLKTINISNLDNGVYLVKLYTDNSKKTIRIIKE